eukprot:SAG11_NODE_21786_length_418_cov_9.529781_1_plen_61_part_00
MLVDVWIPLVCAGGAMGEEAKEFVQLFLLLLEIDPSLEPIPSFAESLECSPRVVARAPPS